MAFAYAVHNYKEAGMVMSDIWPNTKVEWKDVMMVVSMVISAITAVMVVVILPIVNESFGDAWFRGERICSHCDSS